MGNKKIHNISMNTGMKGVDR